MRFEVKFTYPAHFDSQVLIWVKAHTQGFKTAYPPRRINNVYFDTMELSAFDENIAGISQRSKARYRWYGDEPLPQPGTLEFKNKRAALGWKDNYRLLESPYVDGDTWHRFHRRLRQSIPAEARVSFDQLGGPVLINRYSRRYFESYDRKIRVTLDSHQEMLDQLRSPFPNVRRRINLPEVNILELKCESVDFDLAVQTLEDCPIRTTRFSKYTIGSELR
jgi:VTC domain